VISTLSQSPAAAAHTFSAPDLRDVRRRVGGYQLDPSGAHRAESDVAALAGRAAEAGLPNEFAAFLAQQRRLAGVPYSGAGRGRHITFYHVNVRWFPGPLGQLFA